MVWGDAADVATRGPKSMPASAHQRAVGRLGLGSPATQLMRAVSWHDKAGVSSRCCGEALSSCRAIPRRSSARSSSVHGPAVCWMFTRRPVGWRWRRVVEPVRGAPRRLWFFAASLGQLICGGSAVRRPAAGSGPLVFGLCFRRAPARFEFRPEPLAWPCGANAVESWPLVGRARRFVARWRVDKRRRCEPSLAAGPA